MSTEELLSARPLSSDTRVSVVGVGGAGNNLLRYAIGNGLSPRYCIAVNTDRGELSSSLASTKVLLEDGEETGAGIRKDYLFSTRRLTCFTDGTDMTIVIAGLGGETGTGAAPLIAQWSRTRSRPVVSIAALPFVHERSRRFIALRGLKRMVEASDCTIVIDNSMESNRPNSEGRTADELASLAVSGLTELVARMDSLQRQEFRKILGMGQIATLCWAPVNSKQVIQSAVLQALKNPSARLPIEEARGGVLIFNGLETVSSAHAAKAYEALAYLAGHEMEFSYGCVQGVQGPSLSIVLTGYNYGTAVRCFVDLIENIYDLEYGQESPRSTLELQTPLFQMEQA